MKTLDRLIGSLRGCCHSLPDLRQGGDVRYTMADIGLSAFSLFFMQSPSFPAPSGGGTGALELPNAVRSRQDPQRQSYPGAAGPGQPRPLPPSLRRGGGGTGGGLEAFRQLGGHVLIALDGTEYHVWSIASSARPASAERTSRARTGPSTSTLWCRRRSWRPPGGAAGAGIHRAPGRT
jgi:hypothetical protein